MQTFIRETREQRELRRDSATNISIFCKQI